MRIASSSLPSLTDRIHSITSNTLPAFQLQAVFQSILSSFGSLTRHLGDASKVASPRYRRLSSEQMRTLSISTPHTEETCCMVDARAAITPHSSPQRDITTLRYYECDRHFCCSCATPKVNSHCTSTIDAASPAPGSHIYDSLTRIRTRTRPVAATHLPTTRP